MTLDLFSIPDLELVRYLRKKKGISYKSLVENHRKRETT